MELKNYKPVLNLLIAELLLYLLHKGIFYTLGIITTTFHYSLETLYVFFSACSISILSILIRIKKKNSERFGMAFIWLTAIKILMCSLFLIRLSPRTVGHKSLENINFFVMFILFLTIETTLSVRILNNKQ